MGDHADDYLDQTMDAEELRDDYWQNGAVYDDRYESVMDEHGTVAPAFSSGHTPPSCKHCGQTGLHWQKTGPGHSWRLFHPDGKLHTCSEYRRPFRPVP